MRAILSARATVQAVAFAAIVLLAACLCPGARAQQTSTQSALFLSSGAQLNFNLYGTAGGTGTNGTNSDQLAVTNQFNFSGASPGSYVFAFSHGDSTPLVPGSTYTLITFGSTNFDSSDVSDFQPVPRGTLNSINGTFILNSTNGGPGSLQFQLASSDDMPEPAGLALIVAGVAACCVQRIIRLSLKRSLNDRSRSTPASGSSY